MSELNCEKSVWLGNLKAKHTECLAKASYLTKLVDGTEQVTFQNIERARESLLQANQLQDVLHRMMYEKQNFELTNTDLNLIDKFSLDVSKALTEAKKNWDKVLLWVPSKEAKKDNSKSKDSE